MIQNNTIYPADNVHKLLRECLKLSLEINRIKTNLSEVNEKISDQTMHQKLESILNDLDTSDLALIREINEIIEIGEKNLKS